MISTYEKQMANWNSTKRVAAASLKAGDKFLNSRSNGFRTVERIEMRGRMVAIFTGYPRPLVVGAKAFFRVAA